MNLIEIPKFIWTSFLRDTMTIDERIVLNKFLQILHKLDLLDP